MIFRPPPNSRTFVKKGALLVQSKETKNPDKISVSQISKFYEKLLEFKSHWNSTKSPILIALLIGTEIGIIIALALWEVLK